MELNVYSSASSSSASPSENFSPLFSDAPFKIDKLPAVVFYEILSFFTYEELANCRLVDHFFKRNLEKILNDAFMRLGRELNDLSATIKRRLPRKESERKDHPLNRFSEIISSLETRYTLLSMTYKKYMDAGVSCFVPGKVLDLAFGVLNMIRDYMKRNVYIELNTMNVMRDTRDYSTMAMEHFDLYVVPILAKKLQDSSVVRRPFDNSRYFSPVIRSTTTNLVTSTYNFNFGLNAIEYNNGGHQLPYYYQHQQQHTPQSSIINKMKEQIDDMHKLLNKQNKVILDISGVLNEVTKFFNPVQSHSFWSMVQKMNMSSADLQETLNFNSNLSTRSGTSMSSSRYPLRNRLTTLAQNDKNVKSNSIPSRKRQSSTKIGKIPNRKRTRRN